jgi:hypothetical protein
MGIARVVTAATFAVLNGICLSEPVLTYATLWEDQISLWKLSERDAQQAWFRTVRDQGITNLMISVNWATIEQREGDFVLDGLKQRVGDIIEAELSPMIVLDAYRQPAWLFDKHPDARAVGGFPSHSCNMRVGGFVDVSHPQAFGLALRFFETVVDHLAASFPPGSIYGFQPNFNNELEARWPQMCDIFLSYSPAMIAGYRRWLRAQNPEVNYWNSRWGHQRGPAGGLLWENQKNWTWDMVMPPNIYGPTDQALGRPSPHRRQRKLGANLTIAEHKRRLADGAHKTTAEPITSLAYWDWLRFREVTLARGYARSCDLVRIVGGGVTRGGRCFLHFGEFFTTVDAINGGIFFELAAHPSVTDLIVDTNFVNFAREPISPSVAAILVSAAQPYIEGGGKDGGDNITRVHRRRRVWFEAAVERLGVGGGTAEGTLAADETRRVAQGLRHALGAGAHGLGLTNLRDVAAVAPELLPHHTLPIKVWRPTALLFFPYEAFYAFRRLVSAHSLVDPLQAAAHHAYMTLHEDCHGCQIAIIADSARLASANVDSRYDRRVALTLQGVLPSEARNALAAARRGPYQWTDAEVYDRVVLRNHEGHAIATVSLPVMGRATVQALPDLIVGGPPKGGTSSLFEWLASSPHTIASKPKEINYFDRQPHKPLSWYANHWRQAGSSEYVHHAGSFLFEATPGYLYDPSAPSRAAALVPTATFVFLLRDPAARAHSDHAMLYRQGITPRGFDEMVRACIDKIPTADVLAKTVYTHALVPHAQCVGAATQPAPERGYGDLCGCDENIVAKGLYAELLGRWGDAFTREQIFAMRTEELTDPVNVMTTLAGFVGLPLDGHDLTKLTAVNTAAKPINNVIDGRDGSYGAMSEEARAMLSGFYAAAPEWESWLHAQKREVP